MLTFAFGMFCGWLVTTIAVAWLQHVEHETRAAERFRSLPFWDEVPTDIQEWMDGKREHLTPRAK